MIIFGLVFKKKICYTNKKYKTKYHKEEKLCQV